MTIREQEIAAMVLEIVKERGKMQNPVTGSGGVFLGKVSGIGPRHPAAKRLSVGDKVASLVSLSLTPLELRKVVSVDCGKERIAVQGHAVVFESGILEKIPEDFSEGVFLAAVDVCGAPAQIKRLLKVGQTVLILGLGKAGRGVSLQAARNGAKVLGVDSSTEAVSWCEKNLEGNFVQMDGKDALGIYHWVREVTRGSLADLSVLATSGDGGEMSAILPVRDGGGGLFFGMATSFQRATLGAEGIGKDIILMMGNGYVPGHAALMLDLLREHKPLRQWFEEKFG